VTLQGVELVRAEVPFRVDVGTATTVHRSRALLFVRVISDGAEGWGECGALGDGTAVDPPLQDVERAAAEQAVSRLVVASRSRGGTLPGAAEVAQLFGSAPVDRFVAAAFEMAVTDLELRAEGRSLAASLGVAAGFETVPVGCVLGIPPDRGLDAVTEAADAAVASGAARIRIKVAPGWCVEPVRALRLSHPDVALQVDANGSFGAPEDQAELVALGDFGVVCIEQPLPPSDLVAHAELARRLPVPLCLDESLSSVRRVLDAVRNEACAVACLKPARLGGLGAVRSAHAACAEAGVAVFVGGFFEAGLGRSANLALAARLGQDASGLVSDVGDPSDYLVADPCGYPEVVAGWVTVPAGPGVGNPPDLACLDVEHVRRRWFPATYT
jgi:O-succinylbenzoate synthase